MSLSLYVSHTHTHTHIYKHTHIHTSTRKSLLLAAAYFCMRMRTSFSFTPLRCRCRCRRLCWHTISIYLRWRAYINISPTIDTHFACSPQPLLFLLSRCCCCCNITYNLTRSLASSKECLLPATLPHPRIAQTLQILLPWPAENDLIKQQPWHLKALAFCASCGVAWCMPAALKCSHTKFINYVVCGVVKLYVYAFLKSIFTNFFCLNIF